MLQLRQAGEGVVDLTARNLAMSTAMALHHQRSGDATQQARSERVRDRSTELLRQLDPNLVKQRLSFSCRLPARPAAPISTFSIAGVRPRTATGDQRGSAGGGRVASSAGVRTSATGVTY